jgi:aspartokinase
MTQAEPISSISGASGGARSDAETQRVLTVRRDTVHFEKERGVTEVRVDPPVTHASVYLPAERLATERLSLLRSLAAAGIPIFLVKLLPDGISFAVRADSAAACEALLSERDVRHDLLRDLVPLSIVAGAMRDLSGVMAAIYDALNGAGVRVEQTGDAYNAVLCLVERASAARAADALEQRFALGDYAHNMPSEPAGPGPAAAASGGLKAL